MLRIHERFLRVLRNQFLAHFTTSIYSSWRSVTCLLSRILSQTLYTFKIKGAYYSLISSLGAQKKYLLELFHIFLNFTFSVIDE